MRGLAELGAALKLLGGKELPKAIRRANIESGGIVAEAGRGQAPVVSGTLRSTVRVLATNRSARVAAGGSRAWYARIVHAKNPFLERARDAQFAAVARRYEDHLARALRAAGFR